MRLDERDELVLQEATTHFHFNVETSIHPDIIRKFAEEALAEQRWKIDYVCPNVYLVKGVYHGKLVFMGRDPEEVYDIGWKFNPDTIVKPTDHPWMFPERIGYDVMTSEEFQEELNQDPYEKLTTEEVSAVMEAVTG